MAGWIWAFGVANWAGLPGRHQGFGWRALTRPGRRWPRWPRCRSRSGRARLRRRLGARRARAQRSSPERQRDPARLYQEFTQIKVFRAVPALWIWILLCVLPNYPAGFFLLGPRCRGCLHTCENSISSFALAHN